MTTQRADPPTTRTPSAPRRAPGHWRRRLLWAALAVALTGLVLLGALGAVLRAALAPKPGEWAVDIGRAPFSLRAIRIHNYRARENRRVGESALRR